MKLRSFVTTVLILSIFSVPVSAHWEYHDREGKYLFGYAGVGDNPELYLTEVENNRIPTNFHSLTVNTPGDDLSSRLSYLSLHGQKAGLVLDKLLFKLDPNLTTACGEFAMRPWLNYKVRFDDWLRLNSANLTPDKVAALVINTEINNRCISAQSLDQVTQYVNSKLPAIPTVAGYGASTGATPLPETIPASLSGVLFFKYTVFSPRTDADYQAAFANLKSKLKPEQRIILVPDGFYGLSHADAGWPRWYLGYLALNYMELAKNDPQVVGLVFFLWQGFGDGTTFGTRDLPQNVRDRHRLAGCQLKVESPLAGLCN